MTDAQLLLRLELGPFHSLGAEAVPARIHPRRCCCRACHSDLILALCLPAKGLWAATCLSQVMSQGKNVVGGGK